MNTSFHSAIVRAGCIVISLGGNVASLPAHAGLFDKLTGADKPVRLELTESTDRAATYIKAFSDSGSLARDIKPADFPERKIVISSFQITFATEQVGYATAAGIGSTSVETVYTLHACHKSVCKP